MPSLATNVHVSDHGWFGPAYGNADDVPAVVAAQITNPDVWVGGEAPASTPATPPGALVLDSFGPLSRLAALPNDKTILLTFADEEGIDVDGRKGPAKLRADIEQVLAERVASEALDAGDEAVSQAPTGEASVSS